jgi:hypothetical protein
MLWLVVWLHLSGVGGFLVSYQKSYFPVIIFPKCTNYEAIAVSLCMILPRRQGSMVF